MSARWFRRLLSRPAPKALPPLTTTHRALRETAPHHRQTIKNADAVLRDFKAFDHAFRIVPARKP